MSELIAGPDLTLADISVLVLPSLLGNVFCYFLLGVLLVQVYLYHIYFPTDQKLVRWLVYGISLLNVLIIVFSSIIGWDVVATRWGDLSVLSSLRWAFTLLPCLIGVVSTCVHVFFCWRMRVLRELHALPAFILAVSVTTWGVAIFCGVSSLELGFAKLHVLKPFIVIWLGGSCLCDLLITGTMVYIFFPSGSKSVQWKKTSLLENLVRLTVETGMMACVVGLLQVTLFLACPQNYIYLIPFFLISTV
ncbi:hypothetical protein D9615_007175 [Tricholomella constricta]|uniref:DUF6534 domain-containing protein n=1 Tax=Tricholomella constricta TaxID=117010 RepID=A0A8H5H869_9AGAR|nr:hypothetical protein D9615_007175 [Tricholomella constricta]